MQAFLPFLYPALKAYEDPHLCTTAIGIIGDITRGLGEQSAQFANAFMTVLLENLQSEDLNRNVKIPILTCFGDIALAIGGQFEPYLDTTMGVLRQAGQVQPSPVDYELADWVSQLRDGILEAYTGIVSALRGGPQSKHIVSVFPFDLLISLSCSRSSRASCPVHLRARSAVYE
jgi:importin subunit beta-1